VHLGSDFGFFTIEREHDGLFQTCDILAYDKLVLVVFPVKRKTDMARGSSPTLYLRFISDNQFQ
jgi:hypothetical protein